MCISFTQSAMCKCKHCIAKWRLITPCDLAVDVLLVFLTEQRRLQGGWLLRKAYNMYEKLFKEVKKVHDKVHKQHEEAGSSAKQQKQQQQKQQQQQHQQQSTSSDKKQQNGVVPEQNGGLHPAEAGKLHAAASDASTDVHSTVSDTPSMGMAQGKPIARVGSDNFQFEIDLKDRQLSVEAVDRLYGAVCFGFGCLQLSISLVPPKILKIIEFLGFDGDREHGLKCIETSSRCSDMKSPLAW